MKRKPIKFVFIMIAALIVIGVLFYVFQQNPLLPYSDLDAMRELAAKRKEQLIQLGYRANDVERILEFPDLLTNHEKLLAMKNDQRLEDSILEGKADQENEKIFRPGSESDEIIAEGLAAETQILRLAISDQNDRDMYRFYLNLEWTGSVPDGTHYLDFAYHNYAASKIHTFLEYESNDSAAPPTYRLPMIEPGNHLGQLSASFKSNLMTDNKPYRLKRIVMMIDLSSTYGQGIAPLSISSTYYQKNFWGTSKDFYRFQAGESYSN